MFFALRILIKFIDDLASNIVPILSIPYSLFCSLLFSLFLSSPDITISPLTFCPCLSPSHSGFAHPSISAMDKL